MVAQHAHILSAIPSEILREGQRRKFLWPPTPICSFSYFYRRPLPTHFHFE